MTIFLAYREVIPFVISTYVPVSFRGLWIVLNVQCLECGLAYNKVSTDKGPLPNSTESTKKKGMSPSGRSTSPQLIGSATEMDVDEKFPVSDEKPDAKVIIVNNLTRNVVESHLHAIFGFYGQIIKIDLPLFAKSGQNRGKAALEFEDPPAAHKAASHMDGGQLDGAVLKVELSNLPVRSRSPSRTRPPRVHRPPMRERDRDRDRFRSVTRSRSRSPPPYRGRREPYPPVRDSFRGRPYGRRGPPGRDYYRPGRSRTPSRSRSPPSRRVPDRMPPRRRSPSYQRGGYGYRRSRSRSYSVNSSRSRTRSFSRTRSRSRSMSYSSYSRYSRSRTRSFSRGRRSHSRDDIRDSRSRSRTRTMSKSPKD